MIEISKKNLLQASLIVHGIPNHISSLDKRLKIRNEIAEALQMRDQIAENMARVLLMHQKNEQVRQGKKNPDGSFPKAWNGSFVVSETDRVLIAFEQAKE